MSETDAAAPAPMEGHGAYNRDSAVQAGGLAPALQMFREAAEHVALAPGTEPVVIADYGASEGRNSLAPIRAAVEVLRRRIGAARAISVVHTDLPDNDFGALFRVTATDPGSYMQGTGEVFPFVVGRSFYGQILPAGSVTLGWTSWAVQWLSRVPGPIPDQLQVAFSRDPAARAAYAAQAAADWRCFLASRAAELRPGGRLVVLTMALDDGGDFGYRPCLVAMWETLRELVAAGVVRGDEAGRMAIPTVGRSLADLLAPFGGGRFEGLAVEQADVFFGEDRIWEDFRADRDGAAFGRRWSDFCRASVFPTLAAAIGGPDAEARRAAFFARMADGLAARLAAAPERMKLPLARMSLVREG
jgi:hypothetical protein